MRRRGTREPADEPGPDTYPRFERPEDTAHERQLGDRHRRIEAAQFSVEVGTRGIRVVFGHPSQRLVDAFLVARDQAIEMGLTD